MKSPTAKLDYDSLLILKILNKATTIQFEDGVLKDLIKVFEEVQDTAVNASLGLLTIEETVSPELAELLDELIHGYETQEEVLSDIKNILELE